MHKILNCIFVSVILSSICVKAEYNGPFVLWGLSGLNGIKNSALTTLDDKLLRDFYARASSIIVFMKNSTTKLDERNFPSFKSLINENEYIYLTQDTLTSDPLDYNANAEVINLVGDGIQQDVEMTSLYKDAILNYGEGNVLGILASRYDIGPETQSRRRRAADEPSSTANPTDEPVENNYIYVAQNKKGLIWTDEPPLLKLGPNKSIELTSHTIATADERKDVFGIRVGFVLENKQKTFLKFQFVRRLGGWWSMKSVEVEYDDDKFTLQVVGSEPSAPMNYSYHCPKQLLFKSRNHTATLSLKGIQVQPYYTNDKFGIAYDCVGFFTVPIWAGIMVTFLLLGLLTVALTAIAEIKPPNRFESKSGAQLSFTVQE
uniref:CSON000946 protein n=1 Tax=Culicoides sonorensis TaxID=179676 RepID=A0A336MJL6_CULSO